VQAAHTHEHVYTMDGLDGVGVSPELVRIVRARLSIQDEAADQLQRMLGSVVDAIADELRDALGGGRVTDRMRQAILRTRLDEVLDLLDRAGVNDAQARFFGRYPDLANLADDGLEAAGVPDAASILDEPGARVAIDAIVNSHLDAWESTIERPMASRLLAAMRSAAVGETLTDLSQRIATSERRRIGNAVTEARTRMAEFDRTAQEEAVIQAEAGGAELIRVYLGPMDGITRPFCRALVGLALTREQIQQLNNGQTAVSPLFSGGGYNCRHSWVAMSPDEARRAGIRRASGGDVAAANAGGAR